MTKKPESKSRGPILHQDHKAPVTRRDFLATGILGMSTMAFTAGTTSLLSSSNVFGQATTCDGTNLLCANVPFLCIDGVGGMNIAGGNAIVGFDRNQQQEQFASNVPSDFRRLGIPDENHPSKTGMINANYGLKFHSTSGILEGMEKVLTPRVGDTVDLRKHVDGLLLCAITNDDTTANPINTAFMAQKAGAIGELVQLVGTENTVSGGSSIAPSDQVNPALKPSKLNSFTDSESLLSIGNSLVSRKFIDSAAEGGGARMKSFMQMILRGGKMHMDFLRRNPEIAQEVAKYEDRQSRVTTVFNRFSPAALNPLSAGNPDAQLISNAFGKPVDKLTRFEEESANILNLLTRRIAGTATIAVGNCDYHDGTALNGQQTDREIGEHIGHAIRLAALRNKPLFIHLFTDGGVGGDASGQVDLRLPSRVVWRSDDGVRSAALMIVFNPKKERVNVGGNNEYSNFLLSSKTRQIGYYKVAGGTAPDGHSLSNNVNKLWVAVILNYMATLVNSTDEAKIISEVGTKFGDRFGALPADWRELIRLKSLVA